MFALLSSMFTILLVFLIKSSMHILTKSSTDATSTLRIVFSENNWLLEVNDRISELSNAKLKHMPFNSGDVSVLDNRLKSILNISVGELLSLNIHCLASNSFIVNMLQTFLKTAPFK